MIKISDLKNRFFYGEDDYFKKEGDQLKIIPFSEFVALDPQEKQTVLNIFEQVLEDGVPNIRIENGIKRIITVITNCLKPAPSELLSQVPADIWRHIFSFTTPTTVANCSSVCRKFRESATGKEQILSINRRLDFEEVFPDKITSHEEALNWLEKTGHSQLLEYAEFGYMECTISEEELKRLVTLCPNLKYLSLSLGTMASIPQLPETLEVLKLTACDNLTELPPQLPKNLKVLELENTAVAALPELPNTLRVLTWVNGSVQKILPALPQSLQVFILSEARHPNFALPARLPETLRMFKCSDTNLQHLSDLPSNLQVLYCFRNRLQRLPLFPKTLKELVCSEQYLNFIPDLPNALEEFNFNGCKLLGELPALPPTLKRLNGVGIRPPAPKMPEDDEELIESTTVNPGKRDREDSDPSAESRPIRSKTESSS